MSADNNPSGPRQPVALRIIDRAIAILSKGAAVLAAMCVLVMVILTTIDVVRRKLTGQSIEGVDDWIQMLLVFVAFLGLAHGQREGAHVATEIVVDNVPARVGSAARWLGRMCFLGVVLWLLVGCYERAVTSVSIGEYSFGLAQVPVWPARIAIVVGYAFLALEIVREVVTQLVGLRLRRSPAPTKEPSAAVERAI